MACEDISKFLAASPLLKGCCISTSLMTVRRCRAGQIISDRAYGHSSVCLVVDGNVEVYSIAPDGKDVQLNTLKDGDCFGICNLLIEEELETVLKCGTDTTLVFIPKSVFISAMEQDTAFAMRYAAYCNRKIQFLIHRIERLTMQSCRSKLIEYLLSHQDGCGCITPGCSRDNLARRLGISRAALFRELSSLSRQNLLTLEGNKIIILNQEALEYILFQST